MPETPQLESTRVQLRAVTPEAYRSLYEIALEEQVNFRWRYGGAVPHFEQFVQGIHNGVLAQFLVSAPRTNKTIGLVSSYNADLRNGTAYAAVVMTTGHHRTGIGVEAMTLFLSYLLSTWPLRKVYYEAAEYNIDQYRSGLHKLFEIEGRLQNHLYLDGRYWDSYILASTRDQALDWVGNHLPRSRPSDPIR
jgi:[ribosomal protein S5]-alanine N-acetyltransferase